MTEPTIVSPLTWPWGYVWAAARKSPEEEAKKVPCTPVLDLTGHLTTVVASLRSGVLAYLCIFYLPQRFGLESYPAFGPAKHWQANWIAHILIRNIAATWIICGFWDWFLYFGPLKDKLHKYKMNPVYPSFRQIKHDALWTTSASVFGSIIEIVLCHCWATNKISVQDDLFETPVFNFFMAAIVTHLRLPHFYIIHRMMHPWKTKNVPDLGKILYKKVHSLHHKSYNPTAFSGTNMHPVEATLYYSAGLVPVVLGLHPIHALSTIIDCGVGAWLGHDGFQWPGSGDYFHYLHHAHFDCNYGNPHVPFDYLFGTYAGSKEQFSTIWKDSPDEQKIKNK